LQDIQNKLELFLTEAEDCELISKLATDPKKRELFQRIAARFREMAAQMKETAEERSKGDFSE
jgi:hypothetical protein